MNKKILILAAVVAVVAGCNKNEKDIEKEDFSIGSSAHTITLTLDSPVEAYWITDGENETATEGILSEDGKSIDCTGDWFSAKVNLESPKEIVLTVNGNETGEKRQLTISAYHMGKSGSMVISQKSK